MDNRFDNKIVHRGFVTVPLQSARLEVQPVSLRHVNSMEIDEGDQEQFHDGRYQHTERLNGSGKCVSTSFSIRSPTRENLADGLEVSVSIAGDGPRRFEERDNLLRPKSDHGSSLEMHFGELGFHEDRQSGPTLGLYIHLPPPDYSNTLAALRMWPPQVPTFCLTVAASTLLSNLGSTVWDATGKRYVFIVEYTIVFAHWQLNKG